MIKQAHKSNISSFLHKCVGFQGGSVVQSLSASAGDAGSIASWEYPLKKKMAAYSSVLFFFFFLS